MPDADVLAVPGFSVRERLGSGPCGEVWTARCLTTGASVALRVLPAGVARTTSAAASLRERVRRLSALADARAGGPVLGAHLLHLRDVVRADRRWVLVADLAAGGDLDQLLQRGPLDPGRLRTLGVPLVRVLEELHAAGFVHGGLAPGNVLLTADGRPLLADLGVAQLAGVPPRPPVVGRPAAAPRPADDGMALAALLAYAASGIPGPDGIAALPTDVARVVTQALDPRAPAGGWTSAELRAALERVPARPLRPDPPTRPRPHTLRPDPAGADLPRTGSPKTEPELAGVVAMARAGGATRSGPSRRVVAAVLAVAALTGTGVAAASSRDGGPVRAGPPPVGRPVAPAPAPNAAAQRVDWRALVASLDAARAAALESLDAGRLAEAEVGPAFAADRSAIVRLRDLGVRPHGLREDVLAVLPVWASDREAVVVVTSTRRAYALVSSRLVVRGRVPAARARSWLLRLQAGAGRWRLAEAEPAATAG